MEDVIQHFYSRLIETLPMNNASFRGKLYSAGLLPGDLRNKIKSLPTSVDMAACFMDDEIKNDSNTFQTLVVEMERYNCKKVKQLAKDIREVIHADQSVPGKNVHVTFCVVC